MHILKKKKREKYADIVIKNPLKAPNQTAVFPSSTHCSNWGIPRARAVSLQASTPHLREQKVKQPSTNR